MTSWIIDLILLAVVLLCAREGYRKGLIMEVGTVLCILLSLYGATVVASFVSNEVVAAVKPFAGGFIESVIYDEVPERLGYDLNEYSVNDIVTNDPSKIQEVADMTFRCMGVYEGTAAQLAEDVEVYMEGNGVGLKNAIIDVTCNTMVYAATVTLFFLIILIFLTFLANLPNISFRLPNMDEVDEIGGAVAGVIRGILLGMLAVWVLKFLGLLIGEDTLASTIFGELLVKIGLIPVFLGV